MSDGPGPTADAPRWPVWALAVPAALTVWLFWDQVKGMGGTMVSSSEKVHGVVALAALAGLFICRRRQFAQAPIRGSLWGVGLILLGLALFAGIGMFPFRYGYARQIAIVPVLAGAVLTTCGRRVLRLSLPLLLLGLLAIPIPTRLYLSLTGSVQRLMLQVVARVLGVLPGLATAVHGTDLVVTGEGVSGVLGLGGARWPARLLMMFAVIGVFVAFVRKRSAGRIVWMVIAAAPILLLCDLLRLLCWSLVAVFGRLDPTSTLPRNVSTPVAMLAAYGLFGLAASTKLNLLTEDDTADAAEPSSVDTSPEAATQADPPPRASPTLTLAHAVIAAVLIAAAALGLRPAMTALTAHYAKRPIAIRKTLHEFDLIGLPAFRQGWATIRRPVPVEEIKTDEYCWLDLRPKDATEIWDAAGLCVTYNSKAGDTVAHTPDVCIRQAGASVSPGGDVTIDLAGVRPEYRRITARVLLLRWQTFRQAVVFCFLTEGEFVTTRGQARRIIAWPGNRHTYYSLIMADARYPMRDNPDQAIEMCKTILRESLPVLLNEHYPDLDRIRRP